MQYLKTTKFKLQTQFDNRNLFDGQNVEKHRKDKFLSKILIDNKKGFFYFNQKRQKFKK